jgi:hypothetical protein
LTNTKDRRRRLLAVKAKVLGRKLLEQIGTVFTPDTLLRWHRLLIAKKWDFSHLRRSSGRPQIAIETRDLVVRLATENPSWGYDRIQGALAVLGNKISATTIAKILQEHGLEPAPQRKRKTTWKAFLKAHWDQLAAINFTIVEVWTPKGLVTYYLPFAMELATRRVHFAVTTWTLVVAEPLPSTSGRRDYHQSRFRPTSKMRAVPSASNFLTPGGKQSAVPSGNSTAACSFSPQRSHHTSMLAVLGSAANKTHDDRTDNWPQNGHRSGSVGLLKIPSYTTSQRAWRAILAATSSSAMSPPPKSSSPRYRTGLDFTTNCAPDPLQKSCRSAYSQYPLQPGGHRRLRLTPRLLWSGPDQVVLDTGADSLL